MKSWRWLVDYFDLHRSERNGVAVMLSLILALILLQFLIPYLVKTQPEDFTEIAALAKKYKEQLALNPTQNYQSQSLVDLEKPEKEAHSLFTFNPNTLPFEGFVELGISPKIAGNIIKYRNKGGKFRKPEDFKKIYGLKEKQLNELLPYITITENASTTNNYASTYEKKEPAKLKMIDLNSADSLSLMEVRGIGPAFAGRILKFRNALGGFTNKEQLREVYGIDSAKFEAITPQLVINESSVKRINLNSATYEELNMHPYISSKQANAIIQYRRKHGNFKSVDELKSIYAIDEKWFGKMKNYLITE
ncbi:MAG: ComEA family DNA-binding protein [Bacteroidia bacterium]